jgi:16S rRNA (cytosine967-C5)-methyltransferase
MRLPGRVSAAIEILDDILTGHRPAAVALKDWARANRIAGSDDRAAIGNLVYDALRSKASAAHMMDSAAPRALVLAVLARQWGLPVEKIAECCAGQYGPGDLSDDERAALARETAAAPQWIAGDYPEWLHASLQRAFGDEVLIQAMALARRAPVDLRVNTLKTSREKLLKALARYNAGPAPLSPWGVRLPVPPADGRHPNVEADPAHGKGWFEVQDAGSQIAALLSGARPGQQVADICAGAGGKTLAMAAMMDNRGQLYAHDSDKHRLRPIFERMTRAGVRNVQVIPAGEAERLDGLEGRMDVVVVDAPCSGSGAWRRRPDAKWRFNKRLLADRLEDQRDVLDTAAPLLKRGGRLVYITCSVLPEENDDQVEAFMQRNQDFSAVPYTDIWRETIGTEPPTSAGKSDNALLLTPATHSTDGFFIAVLKR